MWKLVVPTVGRVWRTETTCSRNDQNLVEGGLARGRHPSEHALAQVWHVGGAIPKVVRLERMVHAPGAKPQHRSPSPVTEPIVASLIRFPGSSTQSPLAFDAPMQPFQCSPSALQSIRAQPRVACQQVDFGSREPLEMPHPRLVDWLLHMDRIWPGQHDRHIVCRKDSQSIGVPRVRAWSRTNKARPARHPRSARYASVQPQNHSTDL
jgi:hypothetical protein